MAGLLKNKYVYASDRLDFSRSIFRYEKRHSTNLLSGMIVPVHYQFLYPGDSPDYNFGCVIESAPLISTCLDNIYVDVVSIWTPARLVMTDWNEFLGESHTQAFTINRNITIPKLNDVSTFQVPNGTVDAGGAPQFSTVSRAYLADNYLAPHLGFRLYGRMRPAGSVLYIDDQDAGTAISVPSDSIFYKGVSVLPSRVYELNWNTFFRNENLQTPILIDKTSTRGSHDLSYSTGLGKLQVANKLKTWYNVATPAPSLLDVSLSLGEFMPVITSSSERTNASNPIHFKNSGGSNQSGYIGLSTGLTHGYTVTGITESDNGIAIPDNLYANMASLTVNKMYYALMEQRFANKMMKGRRAVEFYANFFGVQDSDADYDLPKLLVQKRYPLNISQVISTAAGTNGTDTTDLGQRGAYSTTGFGDALIKNFTASEHGFLQTYLIIRGQPSLATGIDKHLAYDGLLDTYLPEFDHIGPVGIEKIELGTGAAGFFGYTNAWYSERNPVSDVVGILHPKSPLAYKTLALSFDTNAVISDAFLRHSPKIMDRIFQFPVCYNTYTVANVNFDSKGQDFNSDRYQFLTQFVVKGKIAKVMSPDSEPLKLRL